MKEAVTEYVCEDCGHPSAIEDQVCPACGGRMSGVDEVAKKSSNSEDNGLGVSDEEIDNDLAGSELSLEQLQQEEAEEDEEPYYQSDDDDK